MDRVHEKDNDENEAKAHAVPEVRNIGRIEQCKLLLDRLSLTSNLLPFAPEALDGEPSPFILLRLTRPFLIFTLFLATAPLYSAHSL